MSNYKIIKIIDDTKVLINAGYRDKITKNDILEIYLIGEEVVDPETKVILGTLDLIKATITPIIIYEKMSICVNTETETNNTAFLQVASSLGRIYGSSSTNKRLNVDTTQITGGLKSAEKIKIGDTVRKISTNLE